MVSLWTPCSHYKCPTCQAIGKDPKTKRCYKCQGETLAYFPEMCGSGCWGECLRLNRDLFGGQNEPPSQAFVNSWPQERRISCD